MMKRMTKSLATYRTSTPWIRMRRAASMYHLAGTILLTPCIGKGRESRGNTKLDRYMVGTMSRSESKSAAICVRTTVEMSNPKASDTIIYNNVETEDGGVMNLNIAQYIDYNLSVDGLKLANPLFAKILEEAVAHSQDEGFNAEQLFIHHEDMDVKRKDTDLCVDK